MSDVDGRGLEVERNRSAIGVGPLRSGDELGDWSFSPSADLAMSESSEVGDVGDAVVGSPRPSWRVDDSMGVCNTGG